MSVLTIKIAIMQLDFDLRCLWSREINVHNNLNFCTGHETGSSGRWYPAAMGNIAPRA